MCDFKQSRKQRDYKCGHIRWLAIRVCDEYKRTGNRRSCGLNVLEFEDRPNDICGECKPNILSQAPWMNSFLRSMKLPAPVRHC
ncbi:hypothetical protein V8F20_004884 [Naviculisporaceae sp. PSN 640]